MSGYPVDGDETCAPSWHLFGAIQHIGEALKAMDPASRHEADDEIMPAVATIYSFACRIARKETVQMPQGLAVLLEGFGKDVFQ